jgi:hypothetical protein
VGTGIGNHSDDYIDRNCDITIAQAKPANLEALKQVIFVLIETGLNPSPIHERISQYFNPDESESEKALPQRTGRIETKHRIALSTTHRWPRMAL